MFYNSLLGAPALAESPDRRKCIRGHIRMVMDQLEEVLTELKDVARELREVVAQIDRLTVNIDLDTEENNVTLDTGQDTEENNVTLDTGQDTEENNVTLDTGQDTEENNVTLDTGQDTEKNNVILATGQDTEENNVTLAFSSERELREVFRAETFSKNHDMGHLLQTPLVDTAGREESCLCRQSCGDLPALNGATVALYSPTASWLFDSRKTQCCDKTLYHALCCDDDDDDDDLEEENCGGRSSRFSSSDSVFSTSPSRPVRPPALLSGSAHKWQMKPGPSKATLRNRSTQTVSDKSTQTPPPYSPAKQQTSSNHKY
ncbi:uncharacterized protein LOC143515190 [Brachyhypopomus gauderio]|uniref:uncharacterized protein LOC143515190 n=1 Tax=Brachyhypopomus gauderio TaxID=698409 RepID=UPI0040430229